MIATKKYIVEFAGTFILVLSLSFASCSYGLEDAFWRAYPVDERLRESSAARTLDVQGGFSFIFATDFHYGSGGGPGETSLDFFADRAKKSGISFAAFGGDIADTGAEAEFLAFRAWADKLQSSDGKALPWFSAIGNHDIYNGGWSRFAKNIGPSYTRIEAGPISIYCIDTADGIIGEGQLERLTADFGADSRPKIVISHYALRGDSDLSYYRLTDPRERIAAFDLFARNGVKLVLAGHSHFPYHYAYGAFDEYVAGTINETKGDRRSRCIVVNVSSAGEIGLQWEKN